MRMIKALVERVSKLEILLGQNELHTIYIVRFASADPSEAHELCGLRAHGESGGNFESRRADESEQKFKDRALAKCPDKRLFIEVLSDAEQSQ